MGMGFQRERVVGHQGLENRCWIEILNRLRQSALLYLCTAITTFAAGVVGWQPVVWGLDADVAAQFSQYWGRGAT